MVWGAGGTPTPQQSKALWGGRPARHCVEFIYIHLLKVSSQRRLAITNYQLPITNYQLPITHYPLPITHDKIPVTHGKPGFYSHCLLLSQRVNTIPIIGWGIFEIVLTAF
jgi:hypothetical protein